MAVGKRKEGVRNEWSVGMDGGGDIGMERGMG